MPAIRATRESWLESAVEILRPRFSTAGMPLPEKIHVSVGFGYGSRKENATILGQCWARVASVDHVNHVFISPELSVESAVLGVLLHELIHAADDCENGHKGAFAETAVKLGLEGKMTETLPSLELEAELITMAAVLGEYPHGALDPTFSVIKVPVGPDGEPVKVHSGPGKQANRSITCKCPECGYAVRTTRVWLEMGSPICPVHMASMDPIN